MAYEGFSPNPMLWHVSGSQRRSFGSVGRVLRRAHPGLARNPGGCKCVNCQLNKDPFLLLPHLGVGEGIERIQRHELCTWTTRVQPPEPQDAGHGHQNTSPGHPRGPQSPLAHRHPTPHLWSVGLSLRAKDGEEGYSEEALST